MNPQTAVLEAETPRPAPPAPPGRVKVTRAWVETWPLRSRLLHEGCLLALALFVIGMSFAIPLLESRGAWVSIPCVFNKVTHLPCLICGLTRSFIMTAHGNLGDAFTYHLLGPVLFAVTFAIAIYLAFALITGKRFRYTLSKRASRVAFSSAFTVFLICWALKLAYMKVTW